MISKTLVRLTLIAGTFASVFPATAAALKTDASKSSVSAVFKQMNVPVEAKFRKFNAQIDFDSAKPQSAKAAVDIEVGSLDIGDEEYNKEIRKKEWFNAAQFPKANFVATALKPASNGKLDVTGKLTIKGKTADVSFPLAIKNEGGSQIFEGSLPIRRLTFNIGEGEWKDTGMVADEVIINFRVVTTQ